MLKHNLFSIVPCTADKPPDTCESTASSVPRRCRSCISAKI